MAEEKTKSQDSGVAEIKRELIALLAENGMEPQLINMLSKMQPYKIQYFARVYQGYAQHEEYVRGRIREVLERDKRTESIKTLLEKEGQNFDEEAYLDFAVKYYRKALALEFIKTEMHEYMNGLGSSQDRTAFMVARKPDKVRAV